MRPRSRRRAAAALGTGAAAMASSVLLLRKWQQRWSATAAEVAKAMPLDDRVLDPTYVTNRAITIRALPEQVWPWIVQMGELPRGGFYSYVTVERLLRMKVENANRLLRDFQTLNVGQAIDRAGTMLVQAVEANRFLVLGPPPMPDLKTTWALALFPTGDGATRLVSRCRARLPRSPKGLLWSLILDPGQFLMERKMLIEIKKRAESIAATGTSTATATAPWTS
jgi:hypothetical protein